MLARHYGLDCDPVYERQWRLSDHGTNAVADYLSKISDVSVVVAECSSVIPETAEAMEGLLKFGIRTAGESDPASREKFRVYLKRLDIYQEIIDARNADSQRAPEESHFDAAEFERFRDDPLLDLATFYAAEAVDVAAVSAMMHSRDAASEMAAHALSIIAREGTTAKRNLHYYVMELQVVLSPYTPFFCAMRYDSNISVVVPPFTASPSTWILLGTATCSLRSPLPRNFRRSERGRN